MKLKKLALCLTTLVISQQAFAWGQTGHRVVGEIAQRHLSADTKTAIAKILPHESLAEASTYADEMRSDPAVFWKKTSPPWHYVTVPQDKTYAEVGAPEQGDAYYALQKFTKVLKDNNASLEDKKLALRFVIHLVGDLHQPLHAGNGTDKGGNDVKLKFFWEDTNLHSVWDTKMIEKLNLSYSELTQWLDEKITPEQLKAWDNTDPLVWIAESTKIRDDIYPDSDNINYSYLYNNINTVKQRLKQGGVRLADYLNMIFDK
ncbi:S1/P1 nuclease [Neptunicella marina]|uniref:S1/P1 nuclease n=1 Tax=Neptunicella marina TaxID=2125989 RepID=A0A8J6IRN9_9ALTE|nr:S1/P1 nuclease [Neptunicella marina]MBC3765154.1 S1/P1 nuclease [Neptunicella marina]